MCCRSPVLTDQLNESLVCISRNKILINKKENVALFRSPPSTNNIVNQPVNQYHAFFPSKNACHKLHANVIAPTTFHYNFDSSKYTVYWLIFQYDIITLANKFNQFCILSCYSCKLVTSFQLCKCIERMRSN